jgi:hypothetical protein
LAADTDEPTGATGTGTSAGETMTFTSHPDTGTSGSTVTTTDSTPGVESSGEETTVPPDLPPPPPTCREILECMLGCLASFDLACIQGCAENAEPQEGEAALALMYCVLNTCVEKGSCSLADLQLEECMTCVGFGVMAPEPTGCEEEAAACT